MENQNDEHSTRLFWAAYEVEGLLFASTCAAQQQRIERDRQRRARLPAWSVNRASRYRTGWGHGQTMAKFAAEMLMSQAESSPPHASKPHLLTEIAGRYRPRSAGSAVAGSAPAFEVGAFVEPI